MSVQERILEPYAVPGSDAISVEIDVRCCSQTEDTESQSRKEQRMRTQAPVH
eukprot:SAG31_NODE_33093_length_348_cov_0.550201_1_plen_51_part_10